MLRPFEPLRQNHLIGGWVNPGVMSLKDNHLRTVLGLSTLRMEAAGSSKTLVTICQIAWCHILQDSNLQI